MTIQLRIGSVRHVRATVLDQLGHPAYTANEAFAFVPTDDDVVELLTTGDPFHVLVSGEAPGLQTLRFTAEDNFSAIVAAHEVFQVVDATRFQLTLVPGGPGNVTVGLDGGVYTLALQGQGLFGLTARVTPIDELFGREVAMPVAWYASGLASVEWSSSHPSRMQFDDGGVTPGPVTGTLTVGLVPLDGGDVDITVSGENSLGDPVVSVFPFRIVHAAEAQLGVTLV